MKINFLGAAGEVTGSSFLITSQDEQQFLVDLGMFQGAQEVENLNYQPLNFNPAKLSGVVLTHAHLDHCGRLPLLILRGFQGKIYMTSATQALMELNLSDAAKIMQEDLAHEPLYTAEEVSKILKQVEIVEYDQEFQVGSFAITFKNAGHILGSASISFVDTISRDKQKAIFSGDLGNSPEDIVKPTEYFDAADMVLMESTYGDKVHPQEDVAQILQEEINAVEKSGGVLLIPAFSLERTQEILHRLHHLKKDKKILAETPVFMDSPMAIHATTIFKDFKQFYNDELKAHTDDPFGFENLVITENPRDSKEIIRAMNPKVIIAGSGMMSGGRILHHAINYLPDPSTRLLFVGYQAEDTLGHKILEGARGVQIRDQHVQVKAKIREIKSLSSHADQPKLLDWLSHVKHIKKLFLIHGDTTQREVLAKKVKESLHIENVFLPLIGDDATL